VEQHRARARRRRPRRRHFVQEGRATATVAGEEVELGAGDIVVVHANEPHAFTNAGDGPLRQVDIHLSPRFVTDWLDQ
jgi:mannose-6-phosphate isomerase-like protein (cupin superfamily)